MLKYVKEVERLERAYQQHINTLWNMASKAKFPLMKRFFVTVASRVRQLYDIANRDVDAGELFMAMEFVQGWHSVSWLWPPVHSWSG